MKKMIKRKDIRLLALSQEPMSLENGKVQGKTAHFLNELGTHFDLVGIESIQQSKLQLITSLIKSHNLVPHSLRIEATLNVNSFDSRSSMAEQQLKAWDGHYDLIIQIYTLLSPGINFTDRRYIVYTDNTYAMSLKHWPDWLPHVNDDQHQKWMDRERAVYENAKYIFAWSEFTRQSMIHDYGIDEDKVVVAHVGANFYDDVFTPAQYDSKIALFVGNDFERKGGLILLDAWKKVIKALPDAKLRIVGAIKNRSLPNDYMNLPKGVEWIGRVENRDYLKRLFRESAIFVMPSLFEPYGMVYKEAMGIGLACIGPNGCAFPEFITDGESGLLVEPNDADDLAEQLIKVLSKPDYAKELGRKSHKVVTENYTWPNLVEGIEEYIVKAVES